MKCCYVIRWRQILAVGRLPIAELQSQDCRLQLICRGGQHHPRSTPFRVWFFSFQVCSIFPGGKMSTQQHCTRSSPPNCWQLNRRVVDASWFSLVLRTTSPSVASSTFYCLERREGGVRKPALTVVTFGAVLYHLFTCTLVQAFFRITS